MTEVMLISIPVLLLGLWMYHDSHQLGLRGERAEKLMNDGIPERDAMERSGFN